MTLPALVLCIFAQMPSTAGTSPQPGVVTVLVVDSMNVQLPGVEVSVRAQFAAKRASYEAMTNAKGEAKIGPLEPGSYGVSCRLFGLDADYFAVVRVVDRPARVILSMSPSYSTGDPVVPGEPAIPPLPRAKITPASLEKPR